jgi:trehalose 6-phosphate phosphatase
MRDPLPALAQTALFLDMDGTLIDLAPTPDSVIVPPGLPGTIANLRNRLGGALAIVTGRPIDAVDTLLPGAAGAIAGEHGAALRRTPAGAIERPNLPIPPDAWYEKAERLACDFPGAIMERKAHGLGLHFRLAPEAGDTFRSALTDMIADAPAFHLMPAHMLWEIRPTGADKGGAVSALMAMAPFAGRLPVFIGDDVTDEDGMRAARELGGAGYRVDKVFGDPSGVRDWLRRSAEEGAWATLP